MYGMVLPRFVTAALQGEPLQVYGDGNQTRCFCHVADVVDALVRLIAHPRRGGQVFNLGSDEEISINDLAKRVIELGRVVEPDRAHSLRAGVRPEVRRHAPPGAGPVADPQAAIGFARQELDEIVRSVIEDTPAPKRGQGSVHLGEAPAI